MILISHIIIIITTLLYRGVCVHCSLEILGGNDINRQHAPFETLWLRTSGHRGLADHSFLS